VTCWFYLDDATRSEGCVVSRFMWRGAEHVVIEALGGLLIRDAFAISEIDESRLGFGDTDDALAAEIADVIMPLTPCR
jgi:hypothetical protein